MRMTKAEIDAVDLSAQWALLPKDEDIRDWWAPFYKTFAVLSTKIGDGKILELGTRWGQSALALGYCKGAFVTTYDTWDWGQKEHYDIENIDFRVGDGLVLEPGEYIESDLIYLDVDPHNGIMELGLYRALKDMGYRGMMVCDDIHDPASMRTIFWDKVDLPKVEFPEEFGHSTGMGAIFFGEGRIEFE